MTPATGTARVQVAKWGNSQGVRISKDILERAHVVEGDELLVLVEENGRIVLEHVAPEMTLESLLAGVTHENKHKLQEWGKPVGNEK